MKLRNAGGDLRFFQSICLTFSDPAGPPNWIRLASLTDSLSVHQLQWLKGMTSKMVRSWQRMIPHEQFSRCAIERLKPKMGHAESCFSRGFAKFSSLVVICWKSLVEAFSSWMNFIEVDTEDGGNKHKSAFYFLRNIAPKNGSSRFSILNFRGEMLRKFTPEGKQLAHEQNKVSTRPQR